MAATRSLLKFHSNLTSQFLHKPFHFTTPIVHSTIIDETLCHPLSQKSQHPTPSPSFFLSEFLGGSQKLFVGEETFLNTRQFDLQTGDSSCVGFLLARGRGGSSSSSRKQVDSDEEFDEDEVDEFDDEDSEDFSDADGDDHYGELSKDFDDAKVEEEKPKRKK